MKTSKLFPLALVLILLATFTGAAGSTPLAGPCVPGATYNPACDVDHDGDMDIFDVQLAAGHWGQAGTYNIYPAMVPKTGQTTAYAAGDDGALQKGVAWPNPRFTDNNNGTVTDNLTGLIWLKRADCFGSKPWATALSDANTLNSGECGLSDGSVEGNWRLPNVRELQSLIDYGQSYPAMPPGHPFTGAQSNIYWASTTVAYNPSSAWIVSLFYGIVYPDDKTSGYFVWPVRGGP